MITIEPITKQTQSEIKLISDFEKKCCKKQKDFSCNRILKEMILSESTFLQYYASIRINDASFFQEIITNEEKAHILFGLSENRNLSFSDKVALLFRITCLEKQSGFTEQLIQKLTKDLNSEINPKDELDTTNSKN